jgi:hypothetical protein
LTAKAIKFSAPEALFPPVADSSRLLVACRREDYSASRVARAVEDCDAHVLNLNVVDTMSQVPADTSLSMLFDLRVSHRSAESVARSLERYGYTVLLVRNADGADSDTLRQRMDGLLRYLDL